jgi:ABC-type multidrug transport system fused ATPase/permease subunit
MRFHAPSQGSIFIDGQPIETFKVRELRNHIIYINQDTTLFNQTIMQNICMDNKNITPEYVSNALTKFNLLSILAEDKNNPQLDAEAILNRSCGVDGKNLSKGQQKIISLFRSLVALPPSTQILLLDEPLASLDAESRRGVLLMIGDILEQRPEITLIMTTHVMDDHQWLQRHRFQSFQPWV